MTRFAPTLEPLDPRSLPSVPIGVIAAVVIDPPPVQLGGIREIDSAFVPVVVTPELEAAILLALPIQ